MIWKMLKMMMWNIGAWHDGVRCQVLRVRGLGPLRRLRRSNAGMSMHCLLRIWREIRRLKLNIPCCSRFGWISKC